MGSKRRRHLARHLAISAHTSELCAAYRRQLGSWRYAVLRQVQAVVVPEEVRRLLRLPERRWARRAIALYRPLAALGLRGVIPLALIPPRHLHQARSLDRDAA